MKTESENVYISMESHCYLWGIVVWPLLHGLQEHVYSLL
jgi:hypothetical protein